MNAALRSGDTPFGVVVRPLAPTRRTLATRFPAESGTILRHRAIVLSGAGLPLAAVVESYTPDFLAAHSRAAPVPAD